MTASSRASRPFSLPPSCWLLFPSPTCAPLPFAPSTNLTFLPAIPLCEIQPLKCCAMCWRCTHLSTAEIKWRPVVQVDVCGRPPFLCGGSGAAAVQDGCVLCIHHGCKCLCHRAQQRCPHPHPLQHDRCAPTSTPTLTPKQIAAASYRPKIRTNMPEMAPGINFTVSREGESNAEKLIHALHKTGKLQLDCTVPRAVMHPKVQKFLCSHLPLLLK